MKKDFKIVKEKVERKSIALKAKKESSDEVCSTSRSEDEEYAMAIKDFKKFFKRRDAGTQIILLENVQSHRRTKNQRAFVRGSWSDSGEEYDEKVKNKTCLIAQASSEICLGVELEPDEWIKYSECSKHMTGNRKLFLSYKAYNRGNVIFGSNLHGNILEKRFDETFSEAWNHFKDLPCKCPHHGFSKLHQIDTFYNALMQSDQDSLNAAASGYLLNYTPRDALTIIENKSKVLTSRNKPVVSKVSATSSSTPAYLPEIIALTDLIKAMLLQNKTPSQPPLKL
nr:reverse transcriptase domain-containing protein [Tanacetum cinerariifolium]